MRLFLGSSLANTLKSGDNSRDKQMGLCGAAEASFQLNMIGRWDDCIKWRSPDLRQYDLFPNYGYLARMCWSKYVREERDAPLHHVLGVETRYCAVTNVAILDQIQL